MVRYKEYDSYIEYINHQAQKLTQHKSQISKYDKIYKAVLTTRLQQHNISWVGKSVLCLGARLGGEVRAFRDLGCFAIGIDINPGPDSPYVLWGDFHALAFPAVCVDVVFTNSLDHSLDLGLVLLQAYQVLSPLGLFVTEVVRGTAEGYTHDSYDVCRWNSIEGVAKQITKIGFAEIGRQKFERPWPGMHILWRKL